MRSRTPLRPLSCLVALALATVALGVRCGPSDGFVSPAWMESRQKEWLSFATEAGLSPGSPSSVLAHMESDSRYWGFELPAGSVPDDAWDDVFDKMWRLRDTSDFDALRFIDLLYAHRGHPAVSEALWQKTEQALFDFKYWYTDPTPARVVDGQPVVDDMWYWTENHVLIFKVVEYLAGQRYPDRVFSVTGQTGAWHRDRADGFIRDWLRERALLGFTEWHSNVYYNLDIRPLLVFIEWADDPALVRRASMVLDLVLLDIALHLHDGTFGATHGRSYIKDKPAAVKEDTFDVSKFFFDDTDRPYQSRDQATMAAVAHARRYRLPEVLRTIARSDAPMVDKERMNLPLNEVPPSPPSTVNPPAPLGWDFQDETYLPYWWSTGGMPAWQHVPLVFEVAGRHGLFDAQFRDFADLVDLTGGSWVVAQLLLQGLWPAVNFALLKEVNTYTYRTDHYMLSTAQDYRKGARGSQTHIWQATLDDTAIVFTTHPTYRPEEIQAPPYDGWNWQRRDESGAGATGGRWTGDGAHPRSAQIENVGISIYSPLYPTTPQLGFEYVEETHAYFPVAHFDEVVRDGHWTFGRKGKAYVALYSWREVDWRGDQPEVHENGGLDFDLVAEGGADNVWIVELGSKGEWPGGFEAFRAAFHEGLVTVTPTTHAFQVAFESPSRGTVEFGWEGPLVVNGADVPISDYKRFDNPWVQTDFMDTRYVVSDGAHRLVLDFVDLEDESQDVRNALAF